MRQNLAVTFMTLLGFGLTLGLAKPALAADANIPATEAAPLIDNTKAGEYFGYMVGTSMAAGMKADFPDLDMNKFVAGFEAAMRKDPLPKTQEEISKALQPWIQFQLEKTPVKEGTVLIDSATAANYLGLMVGTNMATGVKIDFPDMDMDAFQKSIISMFKGETPPVEMATINAALERWQGEKMRIMNEAEAEKLKKLADESAGKAKTFLAENRGKEGVKETPSGLQYRIEKEGTGKTPTTNDVVVVHYRGTLLDGTEFDSSYKNNENKPVRFPLNAVIAGWTEGLQYLKEGGKAIYWIPADLAYGEAGRPGIPPNALLTFEVELLNVAENPTPDADVEEDD